MALLHSCYTRIHQLLCKKRLPIKEGVSHYFLGLGSFNSAFNALNKAMTMRIMTTEKGNAATIIVFWTAVNPPTDSRIAATSDCAMPQRTLIWLLGSSEPFVDCMPSTNVAESAEVMKNVLTSKIANRDITKPSGISLNIANKVCSVGKPVKSIPLFWISMAVVPNAANQKEPKMV